MMVATFGIGRAVAQKLARDGVESLPLGTRLSWKSFSSWRGKGGTVMLVSHVALAGLSHLFQRENGADVGGQLHLNLAAVHPEGRCSGDVARSAESVRRVDSRLS
jgi:hypothetical protein